jgi:sarcosine oxidase subunit beta
MTRTAIRTADAIIIGAGVIGAATAFEMAKQGWKTLSVDRNTQAGHGSTAGSCAIIRMHYSTLDGTAFAYEGYHYWRDWAEYLETRDPNGLARFREIGCLVMKTGQNGYLAKHIENSRILGCPFEEWDAERITRRLPIYDLTGYFPPKRMADPGFGEPAGGGVTGAVFWPNGGYVNDPALSAQNLAFAAKAKGAEFLLGATVTEILRDGGRVKGVKLADGEELHAPVVINVGGPASSKINAMAGVLDDMTIATRPLRQEVVHVPSPEGFDFERDGLIVSDSDIACYCRPEHGNNILVGSEDPPCDPHQWVEDDTDYDRDFTGQWTTQAMRYGQRVPSLGIPSAMRGVVDLYDASDDWIPIYDRSLLPGFYMACGTSGNQYKNAPIAGKMMAALVDYCEAGNDHDARPLRFTLPYIGRGIDVGFYSRKREINRESSFSVLG